MKNVEVREENADRARPDHETTWDEFAARRAGEDLADLRTEIPPAPRKRPEAKGSSLSTLLLEAIHAAGARRGRISRAACIRELTLLEVLSETMRRR
jgi:hypothetical protein